MERKQIIKKIEESGLVAVIRADSIEEAEKIVDACVKGGLKVVELTFTVPQVTELIKKLKHKFENTDIIIGAGTVTNELQCIKAIEAGAEFIVSPGFDLDVLGQTVNYDIPYLPGCMTITEMMRATRGGSEIIKLFPGSAFGPKFIKDVKGPLPDIKIMPTGGVDLGNASEWIKNGAVALGVGSKLTYPAKNNDYEKITEITRNFLEEIKKARNS